MKYYLKALKNYADFSGRARRKEYWLFTLYNIIIFVALVFLGAMVGFPRGAEGVFVFVAFYMVGVLIPALAVSVRRLHDTGRSGWWLLLYFVPFGAIVVLVFLVQDSNPASNKFGKNPKRSVRKW
jgi:uncharacterized membrane protein YhaH (DUF805 family)|tara:strand:+ start:123 stop:497 length:375 start_codon:yes stop_codon:yes gene_type:complete